MSRTPEEYHCADYTKLDGEYEDNGDHKPLECGVYQDPYQNDDDELVDQTNEERKTICATEVMEKINQEKENPPR